MHTLMDLVYLEIKQFNHSNGLIRGGCFFNYMFCIKIIYFDTWKLKITKYYLIQGIGLNLLF